MKPLSVYSRITNKRLAFLENAYDINYTQQTNAVWTGSFKLPYGDPKKQYCQPLNFIEIWDTDAGDDDRYIGLFRIMPIMEKFGTTEESDIEYTLEHVMSTLLDNSFVDKPIVEPPPEEPPPPPPTSEQNILTSQSMITGLHLTSYNFNTSGHLDRYMLIMLFHGNPESTAGEYTSISLGGLGFTKITQAGTIFDGNTALISGTLSQIWGRAIPNDWSGSKNFAYTTWGPSPKRPVVLLFQNVNPTSPVLDSGSFYSSSSGALSASLSIACNAKGILYSVLSLRNDDTVPVAQAGATILHTGIHLDHSGGVSRLTSPVNANSVGIGWSWSPGSRNCHSVVSLRPATR